MPRINESVIGDDWKSTVKKNELVTREPINYTPQDGISSDTPEGNLSTSVDESGGVVESPTPPPDIKPSNNPDVDNILNTMKKKGYKILTRPYEMNIVGVRRQYEGQKYSNQFKDDLFVIYKVDASEKWVIRKYNISTMPGFYYGKNGGPLGFTVNKSGTGPYRFQPGTINVKQSNKMQSKKGIGIMMEAQYIGAYKLGAYHNKPALINFGKLKFYRDKSDSEFIKYTSDNGRGVTGMHLHLGFPGGTSVNNWSEGCQVFSNEKQLIEFASLCKEHVNRYGNRFNYTLLLERDLN
jgi:hypothetical protein